MLNFDLPYPPSVNHYWRRAGSRMFISSEGRAFRQAVCTILAVRGMRPLGGPLSIEIAIYPPDNRRRDIDNVLKALLDALQHGGAYGDDSQIVRLVIEKRERKHGGKTIVCIRKA